MVKHFVKSTGQEVKIGDKIHVKVPVSTSYGEGKCELEILITPASLEQLCKDGLVEKKETSKSKLNLEDYRPYIKSLAKKLDTSFNTACELLDILHEISSHAHICILLDLMSKAMNKGKKFEDYVYTVNLSTGEPVKKVSNKYVDLPKFTSFEDAQKAALLIMPFVMEARNEEQKD